MTTDELINLIDEHLQGVNDDYNERIFRIDNMLDYLNWSKRLTELSDIEKIDFCHSNEGYALTPDQHQLINADPLRKDYYLDMWARSTYFRQCAWVEYLSGKTDEKPLV